MEQSDHERRRGRGARAGRSASPRRSRCSRSRSRSNERRASSSRSRDKSHSKKDKKKKTKKDKKAKHHKSAKSKKHKRRRRHISDNSSDSHESSSTSSSDEDGRNRVRHHADTFDLKRAAGVVRSLLLEFPAIAPDLLALLQQLDDGGMAVISGIANMRVKSLLQELFPLLGIEECRKPADAYVASKSRRGGLLETVAEMLNQRPTDEEDANLSNAMAPPNEEMQPPFEPVRRPQPIGPARPPPVDHGHHHHAVAPRDDTNDDDDDDDDDTIGPALPGMKGFRTADKRVEAEMERRARELEEDAWRRVRGEPPASATAPSQANARQEWMTQMPENNKLLADAMGPAMMKPTSGKLAAFRSKEPAAVDQSWFASPEERERANRAKLDMDLLGYVRPENAPARGATSAPTRVAAPGVNESILPAANPSADREMREQMEALREKRGSSLLEQHQKKVAAQQAKSAGGSDALRSTWNRDRDLTARRGLSQDDADRIIASSREISSKFTAPSVTRQFL